MWTVSKTIVKSALILRTISILAILSGVGAFRSFLSLPPALSPVQVGDRLADSNFPIYLPYARLSPRFRWHDPCPGASYLRWYEKWHLTTSSGELEGIQAFSSKLGGSKKINTCADRIDSFDLCFPSSEDPRLNDAKLCSSVCFESRQDIARSGRRSNEKRNRDLKGLQPAHNTHNKAVGARGLKQTHKGGGPLKQPGGGMKGS